MGLGTVGGRTRGSGLRHLISLLITAYRNVAKNLNRLISWPHILARTNLLKTSKTIGWVLLKSFSANKGASESDQTIKLPTGKERMVGIVKRRADNATVKTEARTGKIWKLGKSGKTNPNPMLASD